MLPFEHYRGAVFDCDGVILDSNDLKTSAFRTTLAGELPILVDEFIDYHQSHGGISRYVKFDHFFRVMKGTADHASETKRALQRYAEICRKGLLECALIPGVTETLLHMRSLGVDCYVVSGGDQEEVRAVLTERGLSQYFAGIYGSPRSKMEHLGDLAKAGLRMPAIYFGDAESDCKAAHQYGLDFVYIAGRSEWRGGEAACMAAGHPVYQDFEQLMNYASQKGKE
jgi:phosphoglycolate phosphatase-like HAD superfamily hydrolase